MGVRKLAIIFFCGFFLLVLPVLAVQNCTYFTDKLWAHYRFETEHLGSPAGTIQLDSSNNTHNATLYGLGGSPKNDVTLNDSKCWDSGGCVIFGGVRSTGEGGQSDDNFNSSNPFCVFNWFSLDDVNLDDNYLFSQVVDIANQWYISPRTTNDYRLYDGVGVLDVANATMINDALYFLGMCFDGTTMRTYLNGTVIGTKASSGFGYYEEIDFGWLGPPFTTSNFANGVIDELTIWEANLSQQEISDLWNNSYGCNPTAVTAVPVGCDSDLIFFSGGAEVVSVGEFVPFDLAVNLTYDTNGSAVTGAICNATVTGHALETLSYSGGSELYEGAKTYNFSTPDNWTVSYACDSFCALSASENIEVINSPPVINQLNVTTNETFIMVNDIDILYRAGAWNWSILVNETNITAISWAFYNNTGGQLTPGAWADLLLISTPNAYFENALKSPFNVSVLVTDGSAATDFVSFLFNTGDVSAPVCTGFDDVISPEFTSYEWDVLCINTGLVDTFNVSCDAERYTFYEGDINATEYNFTEQLAFFDYAFVCAFEVCDGFGNCLDDFQFFTVLTAVAEPEEFFSSVPEALFFMFLTAFWFGLVVAVFTLSGRSGDTIQIFNIFQVIIGITVFLLWFRFSVPVAFAGILVSVGIFIGLNMNR